MEREKYQKGPWGFFGGRSRNRSGMKSSTAEENLRRIQGNPSKGRKKSDWVCKPFDALQGRECDNQIECEKMNK